MKRTDLKKILIIGSGPIVIGQGCEFDYSGCQAVKALRKEGYEVVMVNSNPETVSTDYDTSDKLYTFEDVMDIYEREECDGAIVQFGGQTPLNLAERLEAAGVNVLGTSPRDIALAEDRDFFRALVSEVGVKQPPSGIAHTVEDSIKIAKEIGYPVLVRPSFVLGGRGMAIVYHEDRLREYVEEAVKISEGCPILIDKFLTHAIELDVDCVSDGETTVVGAILEHVEATGCHSGDAAAITPPVSLTKETIAEVERIARTFAERLHVVGLMNIQLAVKDNEVWMIEVNPRASRTVPSVVELAKELDALGYEIWATRGTSTALWNAGVESNALYKITLGSPNALDLIRLGKVKWIVNTREDGERAAHDSVKIRSSAVAAGVPVTTTLAGFAKAVKGLSAMVKSGATEPLSLQEWRQAK